MKKLGPRKVKRLSFLCQQVGDPGLASLSLDSEFMSPKHNVLKSEEERDLNGHKTEGH